MTQLSLLHSGIALDPLPQSYRQPSFLHKPETGSEQQQQEHRMIISLKTDGSGNDCGKDTTNVTYTTNVSDNFNNSISTKSNGKSTK